MDIYVGDQTEERSAILIVDDNEINRMILSETFKDWEEILEAEKWKRGA